VLAACLGAAACSGGEAVQQAARGGGRGGGQDAGVPVMTDTVVQKPMPLDVRLIGAAEAYTTVAVRAQVTAQLTSVDFREGDDVKKGQVLFTFDRRPLEAALQQAEAALARDLAQAANAKVQVGRYDDLAKRGIATREQLDDARTQAAALDATVAADRAAIENARVQLQYATIKAPSDGRTGALMVNAGNLVRANDATPLVVINQVAPIYVSFGLPEARLPDLKRYMAQRTVKVDARAPNDQGPPSSGRISFVDNTVDPSTGTIKVKATFPNEKRHLWPGQFVNVVITLAMDPNAIVVPAVAVQTGQQGQYVFVVKSDQTVDLRAVTIARSDGKESVVATGLRAGETVVTDGHLRLVAGSRVSVKPASETRSSS
jgi:membrane fusion protein, multidrug efflux system